MNRLLKLKHLYTLQMFGEEYFEGYNFQEEIATSIMPNELTKLEELVSKCKLCSLHKTRHNIVFGAGNPKAKLMFVGEAPGRDEDLQGKPFVGRSGEVLTKMIENVLNLKRSDVYIGNILKCRPPHNRDPEIGEVENCKKYLLKQIEIIQPKLIVTLGKIAFRYLLDDETPITIARGKVYNFNSIKVIPTFHPSYLLRNPSKKKEAKVDLEFIKTFL